MLYHLSYEDPYITSRPICWVHLNPWKEWNMKMMWTAEIQILAHQRQRRGHGFESRRSNTFSLAFIGNCLNCNYQCNDHIFISDHHLHVSLLLLLLSSSSSSLSSSSSSLFIYFFTYFFTLTVLHFFWRFLTKRCCTKWAWDAGNLGLLILVLVHCTCTTAGSIEKVATRTVN